MADTLASCIRDSPGKGETTEIRGNLRMDRCMEFDGDLIVHGSIVGVDGRWQDLKVKGDLIVMNGNIEAGMVKVEGSIAAGNITAWTVSCKNLIVNCIETEREINAENIHAFSVICNGLNLKEGGDLIAHILVKSKEVCEKRNWTSGSVRHAYIS
jgi:hypothetical protein